MSESLSTDHTETLTADEIAAARAAAPNAKRFGKVTRVVGGQTYTLIFRAPTRAEFKAFRTLLSTDGQEIEAFEKLALTVAVRPSEGELLAILEDWPGLINAQVQRTLSALAGLTGGESAKL
jgi:hypothetical protein